jgi:hypothetical protein
MQQIKEVSVYLYKKTMQQILDSDILMLYVLSLNDQSVSELHPNNYYLSTHTDIDALIHYPSHDLIQQMLSLISSDTNTRFLQPHRSNFDFLTKQVEYEQMCFEANNSKVFFIRRKL